MLRNGRCILAILFIALSLGACSNARKIYMAENLQLGRLIFESGDFKRAFCQLLPLAVEGSCQAQYAVGYMYYYGYGVSRDTVSGLFWINRSASQHYPPAIKALMIIQKSQGNENDINNAVSEPQPYLKPAPKPCPVPRSTSKTKPQASQSTLPLK